MIWHCRKPTDIAIGLALYVNLSFDLSFNKPAILKNLGHWLGLQTVGRGILFLLKICLCGILITALHRGSKDFIFAILFVVQFLMAGSGTVAFLPCFPFVRDILSLLAWLHMYPYIRLWCIFGIKILMNLLPLKLSVFSVLLGISLHVQHPSSYSTRCRAEQLIDLINYHDYWEIINVLTIIVMSIIHMIYKEKSSETTLCKSFWYQM